MRAGRGRAGGGGLVDRPRRDGRDEDRRRPRAERGARRRRPRRPSSRRRCARWSRPATARRRRDHLARPGAAPRHRHRVRHRRVHEPQPRAPRAPRHVRALRGPRSCSLFETARAARPHEARRPARPAIVNSDDANGDLFEAVVREAGARLITYGTDPSRRRPRRTRRGGRPPAARPRRGAALARGRSTFSLAGRFNAHNALAAMGGRGGVRPRPRRDPGGPRVRAWRRGPHGADRCRPAVRRDRRLRAQPGGSREGARPARAGRRGPGRRTDRGLRVGRASATRPSGR